MIRWFVFALVAYIVLKTSSSIIADTDSLSDEASIVFGTIWVISLLSLFVFIVIGIVKVLSHFGIYW